MTEPRTRRLPAMPPTVAPPRPFVERRVTFRRAEDRDAHREKVLLARSLDVMASGGDAESRLAGLLRLLARTAGARRAAVLADGTERRAAVVVDDDGDRRPAEALAAWLDAHAGRTAARRAAAGRAAVSLLVGSPDGDRSEIADESDVPAADPAARGPEPARALLPIPSAGDVVLGFDFDRRESADRLAERLPPQLARHAAVVLALVTDQLAAERELAAYRAGEAERSTFVSTVAHELRSPLTGLRGYLELILGGGVDDAEVQRDFLERGLQIVGSLGDLVGDLLELSRLESGTLSLEIEPFSIADVGERVTDALLPVALERGITLEASLPPRMRAALGDRRRVEQILTNLLANALKFTPIGGTVAIDGRVDDGQAVLVVRDDGAGIAADDRDRIFDRFHRLASHERITGTGLGLPIARDLARRMAGDLGVASVPGAGSAFVLVLPGPIGSDEEAIAATLARGIAGEEIELERQRLLRQLSVVRALPAAAAGDRRPGSARGRGSARLRALATRPTGDPTPA